MAADAYRYNAADEWASVWEIREQLQHAKPSLGNSREGAWARLVGGVLAHYKTHPEALPDVRHLLTAGPIRLERDATASPCSAPPRPLTLPDLEAMTAALPKAGSTALQGFEEACQQSSAPHHALTALERIIDDLRWHGVPLDDVLNGCASRASTDSAAPAPG